MKSNSRILVSILLATSFFAISGCKKTKTKTELLTDGSWKVTAQSINPGVDLNGDGTLDTDLYAQFVEDCTKDNFSTFKSDGSFVDDEGATKCDPTDPQTTNGTWAFQNSESKISITTGAGASAYTIPAADILTLDESTFKISFQDSIGGSLTTISVTWGKK